MHHLIQRMVERRDRSDDAEQRLAHRVDLALAPMRGDVAREHLAVVYQRLVRGEQQHVAGATDFVQRVLQAQAGLERDQPRQLIPALGDDFAGLHQNAIAVVPCQRAAKLCAEFDRAAYLLHRRARNDCNHVAGIRVADFEVPIARHLVAGDAE